MKRTLIVEASANLWGSERALLDLLSEMPPSRVAVCCPPGMPLNSELERRGVRTLPYFVYRLHERSRWDRLRAAFGVLRACLEFCPDVIYLNQSGSYRIALPAATLLNRRIVAHVRIFEDIEYLARQRPRRRRLQALIAISAAVASEIRRNRYLDHIPLHQIYDGYAPTWANTAANGARVGNRLACVGRVVPIKGHDVLIRAIALLEGVHRGVECLIVGDGQTHFVEALKQAAPANHAVQWTGFVRDVVPLLRTCGVVVCPSHREPLGRVIFEAWDAGAVPVVFAGSGGAAEIVAAAQGGLLYEAQQPDSLARALHRAVTLTAGEAQRLVENGRAWMAANCNPAVYGRVIASILSSV